MRAIALAASATVIVLTSAAAADAQSSMQGMDMTGRTMPAPPAKKPASASAKSSPAARRAAVKPGAHPATKPVAGMPRDKAMPAADMAADAPPSPGSMPGMAMPAPQATGTDLSPGDAPAPPPPTDHYAARVFPPAEIDRAHLAMIKEEGGRGVSMVMFNLAEYQIRDGKDGYRWDGEAWFGGDIDRLTLKSEGAGTLRDGIDSAEIQALYSRAVGPYFNLQAGVRHDFRPTPTRSYATIGFEGLTPYLFEVAGAVFVSEKGDVLGRIEGYYDQRITQKLILQPRVELNLSAQDVRQNRLGAGLTDAELGLRLRYEAVREFGPYIGVSYDAKTGRTAEYARADGRGAISTSLVAGVRFWF